MKRNFISKFLKVSAGFGLVSISGLYLSGNLDDFRYLMGGMYRGMRCAYVGTKIANNYIRNGINQQSHEYAAKNLYYCFKINAGCYIKLGQIICQLEHIMPEAYVKELEPLCMECPVSDFESIKKILRREYGRPIEEIFSEIDPTPIGSASLAQVHKGKLIDGTEVAIKVQHAYIPIHCPGDIITVQIGCALAEKIFPEFKYKWLGKEFEINLPLEIDFRNEGKNADRIRELLKEDKRVVIPKIFWEYTRNNILVMSYEEGKSITNAKHIKDNKIRIDTIAEILCDVFNRQIFEFGFVHSDPHPGNLFVRKEKVNGKEMTRLVLLDHGLYRDFDNDFRYNYAVLWRGIITQNIPLIRKSCTNLGVTKVELFMSILTSNTYDEMMDKDVKYSPERRMVIKKTAKQKENLKKYAAIYHKEITQVLNDVRREMLLLMKINEFLRSIDRRMGNPINTFENMVFLFCFLFLLMKYIYAEIFKFEKQHNTRWENICLTYEYYKYMSLFYLVKIYFSLKDFFYKTKEEKEEEKDVEKIFDFHH